MTNIRDKAISAGERTNLMVKEGIFLDVGVGIASKDGSTVQVSNSKIKDYELSAGMTYQKKSIFGRYSSLVFKQSDLVSDKAFTRQVGTYLSVNGRDIPSTDLSIDELYSTGIMKK